MSVQNPVSRLPRYKWEHFPVTVAATWLAAQPIDAVDISGTGILVFVTGRVPNEGHAEGIELRAPGRAWTADVRVVRCDRARDGSGHYIGLEFSGPRLLRIVTRVEADSQQNHAAPPAARAPIRLVKKGHPNTTVHPASPPRVDRPAVLLTDEEIRRAKQLETRLQLITAILGAFAMVGATAGQLTSYLKGPQAVPFTPDLSIAIPFLTAEALLLVGCTWKLVRELLADRMSIAQVTGAFALIVVGAMILTALVFLAIRFLPL